MNSPPRSTGTPLPIVVDHTRPPTRSRASSTVADAPPASNARAAASPAYPAPITITCTATPRFAGSAEARQVALGHGTALLAIAVGVCLGREVGVRAEAEIRVHEQPAEHQERRDLAL